MHCAYDVNNISLPHVLISSIFFHLESVRKPKHIAIPIGRD